MKNLELATISSAALVLALLAGPASAQVGSASAAPQATPQDSRAGGLEDIVVTATRQSTNLQDTPIAITAVTAEAIEQKGITSVGELTAVVPNTQFRKSQGAFGPGIDATIRGIGNRDTSLASEPVVAFYLDDVYFPTLLGSNFDLLDIEHIEVLRGPQGTLFGRNSLAGAVNIISKQPSTSDVYGRIQITAGSYDRMDFRGSLNLPLNEQLALSVSALSKKRTGYQKILDFTCEMRARGTPALSGSLPYASTLNMPTAGFTPKDCVVGHQGGEDVQAYRGSLLWKPSEDLRFTVTGDYIRDTSENNADSIVGIINNRVSGTVVSAANTLGLAYDTRFLTGDPYSTYASFSDPIAAGTVIPGNTFYNGLRINGVAVRGGASFSPFIDLKNWGVSAKMSWDINPDINFLAVVAHREMVETHSYDDDGSPLNVVLRSNTFSEEYWTAEARLSGKSSFIDWVVGGFYFTADGSQHAAFISPQSSFQRLIDSEFNPTSKAVFANATIRPFGEALSFVGGLRYSDDKKVVDFYNVLDTSPSASDTVFYVVPQQTRFDWKAGVNYQLASNALIYVSAATGNSLPGFDPRPQQPSQIAQYDGNDDIAYEIGAKLDLFDRRVRLNLAAFYTDFKNRPTSISGSEALLDANGQPVPGNRTLVPLAGGPAGSTTCGAVVAAGTGITCLGRTYYRNQAAKIRGFEAEYTINPVDGLLINGSVGYTKLTAPDIRERAVNRRQNSPFWTANAGVQYTAELPSLAGSITPRVDWIYESSQVVSGTSTTFDNLMPARSVFNARLTYDNDEYDFSIAVGATNLFDKVYYYNVFDSQALGAAYTNAQPAAPRQFYLTVEKSF
ncbi:iron complex outermembrane receptor protein [Sphingobium sp. B1D7B]|uniref:TonB-dependent receptor n=1 Tax=unclassified Sphingobium TaxID=2611147 RepID=UPI002224B716|nr:MULTISPECIES: TonB-dependent receptor [unclassified Sphingobium]MCW2367627.1 iron complex outermembrane receptor protein [Sphingobium sp. B7D2B]MCW2390020.1 iron complex outermembrane receptor protein [Sphingobium sp. B11D3B]MCW2392054.1 iron complex outermembrane receptor protein [Sphingobium sp. B11D3A]MCW2403761.1 iron complex outermembrane receptor protein [Sphingobium sp. B1D7B]MCW2412701.1 iron complex outermembrane receptor protein [Sphingobium sp. B8D3D]